MTTQTIKALPKEFNFKSKTNPFNLTYHAVEEPHCYVVTHEDNKWTFDKHEFHKSLLDGEYVIVEEGLSYEETIEYALKTIDTKEILSSIYESEYEANKMRSRSTYGNRLCIVKRKVRTYEWEEAQ